MLITTNRCRMGRPKGGLLSLGLDRIEWWWPKLIRAQAACESVISFCSIRSMMNAVAAPLPLAAVHSNNKSLEM